MADTNLQIIVEAVDRASAELQKVKVQMDKMGNSMQEAQKKAEPVFKTIEENSKKIGRAMTVAGGVIVASLGLCIKSAMDAQVETQKLDTILNAIGNTSEDIRDKILNAGSAAVQLGFDDEEASLSIAKLYQRTGDLSKAIELNNLAMDLARAKNLSLEEAQTAIGRVLSGNGRALVDYGIKLKETADPLAALAELHKMLGNSAQDATRNYDVQMKILQVTMSNLQEKIGGLVIPVLAELLSKIVPIIEKIQQWADAHPRLFNAIILAVGIIGLLMAVLGPLLLILPTITASITILGGVIAFLCSPIGLVILAIMALIAIGVLLVTHWDWVKTKAMEIWEKIKVYFIGILTWLKAEFNKVIDTLKNAWNSLWDTLAQKVVSAFDGIKATIKNSINFVINFINQIIDQINSIASKIAGAVGQAAPQIPRITPLANGGIVTGPTLAMIGEAGPEAVVPLSGGFAGAGIGGITININGGTYLSEDAAVGICDKVIEVLKKQLRF